MHCRAIPGVIDPAVAYLGAVINVCYVANYSDGTASPGRDPQASIVNAENNSNPIAAVAMVGINQQPLINAPPNFPFTWGNIPIVQFIVFAPASFAPHLDIDNFFPSIAAILDSEGPKSVPGVCMACHNGSDLGASPHPTSGPRFLPFDTPSFLFDTANASFSSNSQSERFQNSQRDRARRRHRWRLGSSRGHAFLRQSQYHLSDDTRPDRRLVFMVRRGRSGELQD